MLEACDLCDAVALAGAIGGAAVAVAAEVIGWFSRRVRPWAM